MSAQVSVVVPTHQRPDLLWRCLEALIAQDLAPCAYEIIVVDDAASSATRAIVNEFANRESADQPGRIRYLATSGRRGPAAARNLGWQSARGEIIALTDDDCVPDPAWLRCGIQAFTGDVVGVCGRVIVPLPPCPTDYELSQTNLEDEGEFVTANCFYRRDVLAAVGGFDERFTAAWREDTDLFFTLLKRGYRLLYVPESIVVHPIRPAPWGVHIGAQRKSMFNALLYKKHPDLYSRMVQPSPPWHYYQIAGALLLALASLAGGAWRLGIVAALVWAALTGRFCMQRLERTSRAPSHVAEMIVTSICIPPLSIFWRLRGAIKFRVVFL